MAAVPPDVRTRLLGVLFTASALARTGFIATITVGSLVAEDLLGAATLAGAPAAAATVGVAVGIAPIAALMSRRGRRPGIGAGLAVAAVGVAVAASAIGVKSLPLFVVGMFLFGFGSAGDRLSRYAAADIAPPERRSFSISLVVWAGTIGAVVGPLLLDPAAAVAEAAGLDGLAGAPLLGMVAVAAASLLVFASLRPDPLEFADTPSQPHRARLSAWRPQLADPRVRFAIVALIVGQVVMVLIMTVTPVHIRRAGEDLGIVGLVIGAHTFGMFAVSPLTGVLADRVGRVPVMIAGQAVLLMAALLAGTAGGDQRALLMGSLFLLGLGWNFGFVAGSAYLTENAAAGEAVSLQGLADTLIWTTGAAASLSSGLLLEASGFPALSFVGASLVALPIAALLRYRSALAQPTAA